MTYYSVHGGLGATQEELRTRARELYAAGQQAFDEGQYEQALESFQQAYNAYSLPTVFVAIATAQMRLGRFEAAKQAAQRYLYADPEGPQASQARELLRNADAKMQAPSTPAVPRNVPEATVGPPPPAASIYDDGGTTIAVWVVTGAGVIGLAALGYWLTRPKRPKRNRRRRTSRRR